MDKRATHAVKVAVEKAVLSKKPVAKYDNSTEMMRIIRKHKEDISIFPNDYWDEDATVVFELGQF